jgi:pilus assembly protein CpaF
MGRVADVADLAALDGSADVSGPLVEQIEKAAREQAQAMRTHGEAPNGVDMDAVARDAIAELVGLGPISSALDDEEVLEIRAVGAESLFVRKGDTLLAVEPFFTSPQALARVVARLASKTGLPLKPGETFVERRLVSGALMVAVCPASGSGGAITIRKRHHVEASLEELVRSGALSRPMASFLEICVVARTNVVVVGPRSASLSMILAALAAAAPPGEHTLVVQGEDDEIAVAQGSNLSLPAAGADRDALLQGAGRLGTDRIVIASLGAFGAWVALDVIGERGDGVLAGMGAPSLRQGLARLAARLAVGRAGVSVEAAREVVGESFDVALEIGRGADGKLRVLRVSELTGADAKGVAVRDLFVSTADGGGQPSFFATGTTPRFAQDLAAKGIRLDASLFRRAK